MVRPAMGRRFECSICENRVRVRWSHVNGGSWVPIMHQPKRPGPYCLGHLHSAVEVDGVKPHKAEKERD